MKLAATMKGVGQNFIAMKMAKLIKTDTANNLADAQNLTSVLVDGLDGKTDPASLQNVVNLASERYLSGNVGYSNDPKGANRAAIKNIIEELVKNNDLAGLEALRSVEKVPGNKGTILNNEFKVLIDQGVEAARQEAIRSYNINETEGKIKVDTLIDDYYTKGDFSADAKSKLYDSVNASGSGDYGFKQMQGMLAYGFNYDPEKAIELDRMKANGQRIDQDQLDQLADNGTINSDEYKRFTTRGPAAASEKAVDKYLKSISGAMKNVMLGNIQPGSLNQTAKLELITRHQMLMDELKQSLMMEVSADPALAQDNSRLSKLIEGKSKLLLQRPMYTMEFSGGGAKFQGDLTTTMNGTKAWRGSHYDYSSLPADKIFAGRVGLDLRQVKVSRDRFIPYDSLKADVKAVLSGKDASNNTRLLAKKFGLSSQAFVDSQLKAYGLPGIQGIRDSKDGQALMPGADGDIRTAAHAMRLFRSHGFPTRSAAYLAGNLQQEAGLNGRREWWNPVNDGSGRNGGIVSWNNGRLLAIEKRYNRNIKQITELEQMEFMLNEMKTSYKPAYRTFMNPNSTVQDLRRASYQYWGYGEEGERFTYAENLQKYGRI